MFAIPGKLDTAINFAYGIDFDEDAIDIIVDINDAALHPFGGIKDGKVQEFYVKVHEGDLSIYEQNDGSPVELAPRQSTGH